MKKILSVLLVCALMLGAFASGGAKKVEASNNIDTQKYGDVLDIGTKLRHLDKDEEYRANVDKQIKEAAEGINFDSEVTAEDEEQDDNFTYNGGTKYWLGYDNGYPYPKTFTLRSVGENVEIWVADDLSFEDEDSRPTPVVTQEQVDKLRDEFDNNIYPVDTGFFGTPDSHTGENSSLPGILGLPEDYYTVDDDNDRVVMLVDNIKDESYYDASYPFFIAGFYSPTYEYYFDRNIINIDTNSWETRLESTFFGTTAHEFQHLIHDDNDSLEETWINEGMSDFAEYLCGYGHPMGHVNFFLDHPENSLVEWDDHYGAETGPETLADYGQAYLLQLYLNDKYGQDFIQALAQDEDHGFASVNKILSQSEDGIDFEELFRRFTIAVAIDNPEPDNGIYSFDSIDLKINYESALEYDKDGVPAWGGDYKVLENANKINDIKIDGIDFMPTPWKVVSDPLGSVESVLWGNEGHEKANQVILEADLTDIETATLKFDTFIDIEEQWDFGIVQVSTDHGETWTSLGNENTTSDIVPEGYPAIIENLPGFTGYNGGWVKEEFELTPYVGKEILINFNYMTDWGYNESGWFIDNIEIPEIEYYNDCSSLKGLYNIDEITETYVEYALVFINEKLTTRRGETPVYSVLNIDPMNVSEADAIQLRKFFSGGNNYMIVWYAAPEGNKGAVDFTYEITTKSDYAKTKDKGNKNSKGKKNNQK